MKDDFEKIGNINLLDDLSNKNLQNAINNRRSIRAFLNEEISKEDFLFITKDIFEFANRYNIDIFFTNNNIKDMKKGLYKNNSFLKEGVFNKEMTVLGLNQKLSGQSAFTFIFTSNSCENYFYTYILSGFIAQILYLRTSCINLSCSGIGAYFDDETKEFLDTKNNILYFFAIGK